MMLIQQLVQSVDNSLMKLGIDNTLCQNPVQGKQSMVRLKLPGIDYVPTPVLGMVGLLVDVDPLTGMGKQMVWHYNSQMYQEWGKVGA
jgi:hypothetical protein